MSNRKQFIAIDLFSGCGGLSIGLKRAGFKVLAAVDNNALAVRTYSANHPDVCVFECDIRQLSAAKVKRMLDIRKGELSLLAGCPPCQGFSTVRTLNGGRRVRDGRNSLLSEFLRFVLGLSPVAVMLENVPGLEEYYGFKKFLREMKRLGYLGEHRILDAADYGVPQRRRRLIYLAARVAHPVFADKMQEKKTVRSTISGLKTAGESGDAAHDLSERRSPKVARLISEIPRDGGSRSDLAEGDQLPCHRRCNGFKDVYGRMTWDDVSPTITGGCFNPSKGRFIHPQENRAITVREASLLQGFPKSFKFPVVRNKSELALMIGNAFPPAFGAAHAKQIRKLLERTL